MTGEDPREALAGRDVRPIIARPRSGLSGPALLLIATGAALFLFILLDAHRRSLVADHGGAPVVSQVPISSPPPLQVLPAPPTQIVPTPVATAVPVPPAPRPAAAQASAVPPVQTIAVIPAQPQAALPSVPLGRRDGASDEGAILIVDATVGNSAVAASEGGQGNPKNQAANTDGEEIVHATVIRGRGSIIPQGTLIAAVLETPLNSDRPGLARAIVSRDARSFDGSRVLIPRGSRLIGEFQADKNANQRRVLVTWTRLIRPDGVAIRIGSPAADALGGSGIPGRVNTHFFERFTNAVLQSALTIGINRASQAGNGSVYLGLPNQLGSVGQSLLPNVYPGTTIKVKAGAEISIFVAHDLDFSGTPAVR